MSTLFYRLKDPPTLEYRTGQTPVYFENDNCIWIQIDSGYTDAGMWKYNLDKQEIITKYKSPQDMDIESWRYVFDSKNGIIYMINEMMASFNINTKEWNDIMCLPDTFPTDAPQFVYIESPIDEIHLYSFQKHYKYDRVHNSFIFLGSIPTERSADSYEVDTDGKWIYSKLTHELMIFQTYSDSILTCKVTDKDQKNYNWKKYNIESPMKSVHDNYQTFEVILGWNQIVFFFDFINKCICCLDLLHNNKWYEINCNMSNNKFRSA
eukprot:553427_1